MKQERFTIVNKGVDICAAKIEIGEGVTWGRKVDIVCKDKFSIGDRSHLGDDVRIRGRRVEIGADLYHSRGLDVGGGGCDRPWSTLIIGDRCTIHDNHINLAMPVVIGDDVGLSPAVTIYTHGFWWSCLEGFPVGFAMVSIGDKAIIGYRTTILMGVSIAPMVVVGAQSVVTKSLTQPASIYAGNPARFIRTVQEPAEKEKRQMVHAILAEYREIAMYHGFQPAIEYYHPLVKIGGCEFNVENLTFSGEEDDITDDFRDHARRYGLRFYSERPFRSALEW